MCVCEHVGFLFEVNYRLSHISDVHVIGVVNTSKGAFPPEFTPESFINSIQGSQSHGKNLEMS